MKKLLIVSPHSDDALFSCAHAFLGSGYEAQVLTIENNPKRIAEDKALYEFIGVPFHHLKVEFDDQSYYEYFKRFKTVNHTDAMGFLDEYLGTETMREIGDALAKFLNDFKKKNPGYKIVAPLGISHPFHYFIHSLLKGMADYFYREFPHSYKKRSKTQMEETLLKFELHKSIPVQEIHDVKFDLAKKFYKSQSGLLFFEQGYIKKCLPEEIYVKRKS